MHLSEPQCLSGEKIESIGLIESIESIINMAKQQPNRPQPTPAQAPKKAVPATRPSAPRESIFNTPGSHAMLYGRQNFIYMGGGLLLVLAGLAMMSGGAMPDPAKWEPERIYSFQRITLAPIMMVAGFILAGIGIFKKNNSSEELAEREDSAA